VTVSSTDLLTGQLLDALIEHGVDRDAVVREWSDGHDEKGKPCR
jgi:hypothetical protein